MNQTHRRCTILTAALLAIPFLAACASAPGSLPEPAGGGGAAQSPDWSAPVEFGRLRAAYGDRPDFSELCESGRSIGPWFELGSRARWEELLGVGRAWLSHCPVDIDAHFVTGAALFELGREPEAQQHVRWFRGLVDSVLASGDGHSPQTAFVVISVPEEYAVLRALRLKFKRQALVEGRVDAMTVDGSRGTGTVYFDPAPHFRRLARMLEESG